MPTMIDAATATPSSLLKSKPLIMVIEDEDLLRQSVARLVQSKLKQNVEIIECVNHDEAREVLASMKKLPDLVISDNNTTGRADAMIWLEELKQSGSPLKVLLSTAGQSYTDARDMMNANPPHPNLIGLNPKANGAGGSLGKDIDCALITLGLKAAATGKVV